MKEKTRERINRWIGYVCMLAAGALVFISVGGPQLLAQGFTLLNGTLMLGHLLVGNPTIGSTGQLSIPTCTNCTLGSGSTDMAGFITSTNGSNPVLTFGTAFNTAPFVVCSPGAEVEGLECLVTATNITFVNQMGGAKTFYMVLGTAGN